MPKRGSAEAAQARFEDMSCAFPKAKGALGDVSTRYKNGQITAEECAALMLKLVTGAESDIEYEAAVRRDQQEKETRVTDWKKDKKLTIFFNWLVEKRNMRPQTATQYVLKLRAFKVQGMNIESPQALIQEVYERKMPNSDQAVAVLNLLKVFQQEVAA